MFESNFFKYADVQAATIRPLHCCTAGCHGDMSPRVQDAAAGPTSGGEQDPTLGRGHWQGHTGGAYRAEWH